MKRAIVEPNPAIWENNVLFQEWRSWLMCARHFPRATKNFVKCHIGALDTNNKYIEACACGKYELYGINPGPIARMICMESGYRAGCLQVICQCNKFITAGFYEKSLLFGDKNEKFINRLCSLFDPRTNSYGYTSENGITWSKVTFEIGYCSKELPNDIIQIISNFKWLLEIVILCKKTRLFESSKNFEGTLFVGLFDEPTVTN